jgi:uncharacterized protein (TIGR00725 family)
MKRKVQITLIGDSEEIDANNQIAYDIGAFIADKGWILITGGREGVMTASSEGNLKRGGLSVSLLPGENINEGNPHSTVTIATGIGYARNSMNVLSADVVVVVGGASGTLSEIAYAWAYNKPIIACEFAEGWSRKLANQQIDHRRNDVVVGAKNMEELKKGLEDLVNNLK